MIGTHKEAIQLLIKECTLREGDVFLDLGSHLGQELEVLAPMGVEVHSFEPHPVLFNRLLENYKECPNVKLNNLAAWNSNEEKHLFFKRNKTEHSDGSTLIASKNNINTSIKDLVKCVDIAEYIKNINKPIKVLKIDVEGAEYVILEHLINEELIQDIEFIYCEDHERKINSKSWSEQKKRVINYCNSKNINIRNW